MIINGTDGNDRLFGSRENDSIYGYGGSDFINGDVGDDRLFGGAGNDILGMVIQAGFFVYDPGNDYMEGGIGNDTYFVFDSGDMVIEAINEGRDRAYALISYTLPDYVEDLELAGGTTGIGNALANVIIGNNGANILRGEGGDDQIRGGDLGDDQLYGGDGVDFLDGNAGSNVLDGGTGADTMQGRSGADVYYVDDAGDRAIEFSDGDIDTVYASASFTLETWVDTLVLTGVADLDGTGNTGANTLIGNTGRNRLDGGAGRDVLSGGGGDDAIQGGAGTDTAVYSGSRDQYVVTVLEPGRTRVSGPEGTDELTRVERLQFGSEIINLPGFFEQVPELTVHSYGALASAGSWTDTNAYPRTLADVNGDGRADIVGFGNAGVYVSLASARGGFGSVEFNKASFGRDVSAGSWTDANTYPRQLADINGDGRADLLGFGSSGVYAALATGGGGFGPVYLAKASFGTDASAGSWTSANAYPRQVADINGDGRADLVGFGTGGVYAALAVGNGQFGQVYLAKASFGSDASAGSWTDANTYPRQLADINGDNLADLVGFGSDGVYVALATGGGQFGEAYLAKASFGNAAAAGSWASATAAPRALADINGDGKADLVGFGSDGVYVALAIGGGRFGDVSLDIRAFGSSAAAGGWVDDTVTPRMLADVNGDGRADVVGFAPDGVYVSYAFDLL